MPVLHHWQRHRRIDSHQIHKYMQATHLPICMYTRGIKEIYAAPTSKNSVKAIVVLGSMSLSSA